MKTIASCTLTLLLVGMMPWTTTQAQSMSQPDYKTQKARIGADYKVDKTACNAQAGNGKDICVQEAKAKEKIARAELEFSYTGKPADHTKVLLAKVKGAHDIAKERCDDLAGKAEDVCAEEAKAVEKKAIADIRLSQQIGNARHDANAEKARADYQVAAEKCEALAGESKTACMSTAKAKFGQN